MDVFEGAFTGMSNGYYVGNTTGWMFPGPNGETTPEFLRCVGFCGPSFYDAEPRARYTVNITSTSLYYLNLRCGCFR